MSLNTARKSSEKYTNGLMKSVVCFFFLVYYCLQINAFNFILLFVACAYIKLHQIFIVFFICSHSLHVNWNDSVIYDKFAHVFNGKLKWCNKSAQHEFEVEKSILSLPKIDSNSKVVQINISCARSAMLGNLTNQQHAMKETAQPISFSLMFICLNENFPHQRCSIQSIFPVTVDKNRAII